MGRCYKLGSTYWSKVGRMTKKDNLFTLIIRRKVNIALCCYRFKCECCTANSRYSSWLFLFFYGFRALSYFIWFYAFSNWILNLEEDRIAKKYGDIKKRALDILVKDDVDKVLDSDREFNEEISFLNKRRRVYLILWGLTLVIFLIVLKLTSNFF